MPVSIRYCDPIGMMSGSVGISVSPIFESKIS